MRGAGLGWAPRPPLGPVLEGRADPRTSPQLGALCERGPRPRDLRQDRPRFSARARRGLSVPSFCADVSLAPRRRASIHSPSADSLSRRRVTPSLGPLARLSRSVWTARLSVQNCPSSCCLSAATEESSTGWFLPFVIFPLSLFQPVFCWLEICWEKVTSSFYKFLLSND